MSQKRRKKSKRNRKVEPVQHISTEEFKKEYVRFLAVNGPCSGTLSFFKDWNQFFEHGMEKASVFYNSGVSEEFLKKSFYDMTDEEKVFYLETYCEYNDDWKETFLSRALESVNYHNLKKFYMKYVGISICGKAPSKETMARSLARRFLGEKEPEIIKRDEEEKNINSVNLRDVQSIELCEILVPSDVVKHIITYLNCYNRTMLFKVGRICKCFYVTILSTWPKLTVRKKDIFKISILAYKSVREIRIIEEPGESIIQSEFGHIFMNCNENRLRKVTFISTFSDFQRKFKYIASLTKKYERNTFQKVTVLSYMISKPKETSTFNNILKAEDSKWKKNGLSLSQTFPSLIRFENPIKLVCLENHPQLSNLLLKFSPYIDDSGSLHRERNLQLLEKEYTIDKFREYIQPASKIKVLELLIKDDSERTRVTQLLNYFDQLEEIKLSISSFERWYSPSNHRNKNQGVDLEFLRFLPSLVTELSIVSDKYRSRIEYRPKRSDSSSCYYTNRKKLPSPFFQNNSILLQIQKLEIFTNYMIDAKGVLNVLSNWKNLKHLHVKFRIKNHRDDTPADDIKTSIDKLFRYIASMNTSIKPWLYLLLEIAEKKRQHSVRPYTNSHQKYERNAIFEKKAKEVWIGWDVPGTVSRSILSNLSILLCDHQVERFSWIHFQYESKDDDLKKIKDVLTGYRKLPLSTCYPRFDTLRSILLEEEEMKKERRRTQYFPFWQIRDGVIEDDVKRFFFLERFSKK